MTKRQRATSGGGFWKPEMFRIAWKLLAGDRAKYVGLLFGITFTSSALDRVRSVEGVKFAAPLAVGTTEVTPFR
jgi:hypothetical protein